jgi:hypothetical protein
MREHSFLMVIGALAVLSVAAGEAIDAAERAPREPSGAPPSLAELPHWPTGLRLPEELTVGWKRRERMYKSSNAHVLVWTPPGAGRIRAAFLIPNNTDSKHVGEHEAVRKVAEKHEIGIVYLRNFEGSVVERTEPPRDAEKTFAAVLDLIADETGIAEFRHAPWITFGKSSRGRFPFRTTWWFPERVIASISYHGETPTWPMPGWSRVKNESVLHLAINGQHEWSGTWYRHVRPCMLNYHANTSWLTHQVVLYGVGHGNYADMHGSGGWGKPVPEGQISCLRVWDYIALYIDKAMDLRVPGGTYPATKPTRLRQVDRDSGYLIHPRAPEELLGMDWHAFRYKEGKYQIIPWPEEKHPVLEPEQGKIDPELLIRRAAVVPAGERRKMFWVPDRELLAAWLKLHDVGGIGAGLVPGPAGEKPPHGRDGR